MVKLGFIVEGDTEKFILEESDFFNYLKSLGIDFDPEVVNAEGNQNLLPHNLPLLTKRLTTLNKDRKIPANVIIILTDLDADVCITKTKERISPLPNQIVVISVKEIEAWFLSDSTAMSSLLKENFVCDNPEGVDNPFEKIQSICLDKIQRGIGTKTRFANNFVSKHKFSILNAAKHPNCNSAKYFLNKILELKNL
jgi:hypothetical protein